MSKESEHRIRLLALKLLIVFATTIFLSARAEAAPSIWTTRADYNPDEVVTIYGDGFSAGVPVTVKVTRPDTSVITGDGSGTPGSDTVATGPDGTLVYHYKLNGILGTYTVEAIDSFDTVLAATTFDDAAGAVWTTSQFSGQQNVNHYSKGQSVWLAGVNLDASASLYYEITDGPGVGAPVVKSGYVNTDTNGDITPAPAKIWDIPLGYTILGNGIFKITVFGTTNKTDNFTVSAPLTSPDYGDAPDPGYPSLEANLGASHLDFSNEWLGASADAESDSLQVNLDNYDDGVVFNGAFAPSTPVTVDVRVNTSGHGASRYNGASSTQVLYLNAWADWNGDGDWNDVGEKIIGTGSPTGQTAIDPTTFGANDKTFTYSVTPSATIARSFYTRFRLDYGQDAGYVVNGTLDQSRGMAMYGEVEDYSHLQNTAPTLSYSTDAGYGSSDAVDPDSGTPVTSFTYKVVYTDSNNDAPSSMLVYIDTTPYSMTADSGCGALCDGDYTNGEQYVYTVTSLSPGLHNYYFYASDGTDSARLPASGTVAGPTVISTGNAPTLDYSDEPGYASADGVDPGNGDTSTTFTYKVVYTDIDNEPPSYMKVHIDGNPAGVYMALDTTAEATLRDGDYTDGEQYYFSTTLAAGDHNYYFSASDGTFTADLPSTLGLPGPSVTGDSTYTPAGDEVTVTPGGDTTITCAPVVTDGTTTVENKDAGTPQPPGWVIGEFAYYVINSDACTSSTEIDIWIYYGNHQYVGNEGTLTLFHNEGGEWVNATISRDIMHNILRGRVTSFSEFVLATEESTLIELVSFTATATDEGVLLAWETASEIDNAGFNIWRKDGAEGEFVQITDSLIPAQGSPTLGAAYSYNDYTAEPGTTYRYRLEDIDTKGKSTFHDTTEVQITLDGTSSGADAATGDRCFIATAAYGSYLDPHVKVLRDFRDAYLLTNAPGRAFVRLYYRLSPPAADFIAEHEVLRASVRIALLPLVGFGAFMVKTSLMVKLLSVILITSTLGFTAARRRVRA